MRNTYVYIRDGDGKSHFLCDGDVERPTCGNINIFSDYDGYYRQFPVHFHGRRSHFAVNYTPNGREIEFVN